jgi:hypothetical protein
LIEKKTEGLKSRGTAPLSQVCWSGSDAYRIQPFWCTTVYKSFLDTLKMHANFSVHKYR